MFLCPVFRDKFIDNFRPIFDGVRFVADNQIAVRYDNSPGE